MFILRLKGSYSHVEAKTPSTLYNTPNVRFSEQNGLRMA